MKGWISLHRQIEDHWLWEDKPFARGQAWIDILMLANHEDRKYLSGKGLIEIRAGGFVTSETRLAERWGWSRHKVRDFLDVLCKDGMVNVERTAKGTAIFVINYAKFSIYPTAEGQPKDSSGTTEGHLRDTNNNYNNINNENNIDNNSSFPFFLENPEFTAAKIFSRLLCKGNPPRIEDIKKNLSENGIENTLIMYGLEELL